MTKPYRRNGKPVHESGLIAFSDAQILDIYQRRFLGLAQFYKYAVDRGRLSQLKYVMEVALTKTLACKFKTKVTHIYQKYGRKRTFNGYPYKVLEVEVPTKNGVRTIYWGAISLKVVKAGYQPIDDYKGPYAFLSVSHTDLIQRLQANECEICGSHEPCEVHHIRKLVDLKNRWRGRKEKPAWVIRMIALRRKTLIVCVKCHDAIHSGKPLPVKTNMNSGEPDDVKASSPVRRGVCGKVPAKVTRHFPTLPELFHGAGGGGVQAGAAA